MRMSNFKNRSIDPWNPEKDSDEHPDWDHEDYETPFHLMADLLINWPGSTPTSELPEEMRHLRLVEVVAGYPEVSVGRRPLDFPFSERSSNALQLSLFLDEIKCNKISKWHSLRTYLLHWDLVEHCQPQKLSSQPQKLSTKKQVQFLHCLINTIRTKSYHRGKKYSPDRLDSGEVKFLTALHSMHITRREKFWPAIGEGNNIEFKKKFEDKKPLRINTNAEYSYVEHEFKLDKIQTKIRKWANDNGWLNENTRHNLRVGYSTVLESLFAKIRSQILKEKRPGSICVDGGGRITYLSHKSEEEENKWVHEKLLNSMLFGQVHPHPYAFVITNEIERYGKCTKENINTLLLYREYISSDSFWKLNPEGGLNAKSGLYKELLGKEKIGHFYPKLVVGHDEYGDPITMPNKTEKPWEMEQCYFCSIPKPEVQVPMTTPLDMIRKDKFVCQFHFLIYEIGRMAIIRQSSQELKPTSLNESGKISDIIIFDGNAIGKLFTPAQQSREIPDQGDVDMNELLKKISDEELGNLHNLRVEWSEWMHPAEDGSEGDEDLTDENKKQKSQINDILHGLRYQNIIQRQRKSFAFNAMWWTSLRESITENGVLTPWIAAGDDIVLVNQSNGNQSAVRDGLEHIHRNLSKRFQNTSPVTFAGGWAQRKDGSIHAAYEKAHHLEQRASHCWKGHIRREFPESVKDFIGEIKNDEFEQKEGIEYDSKVDFDSASEHKRVFTTELKEHHMSDVDRLKFPSIIISEDI